MTAVPAASGLSWGVLGRFADYVRGSGGTIAASGGAIVDETGMPSWPLVAREGDPGGQIILRFAGSVLYAAHFGALSLDLADPELEADGSGGVLRFAAGPQGAVTDVARFSWRAVPAAGDATVLVAEAVELDAAATVLFGGAYPAGMPLDPFIFVLAAERNH